MPSRERSSFNQNGNRARPNTASNGAGRNGASSYTARNGSSHGARNHAGRNGTGRNGARMAALADKYDLYQRSVQSPECDVEFFTRTFKTYYGSIPLILREDFCGAAAVCCEWVRTRKDRQAIGVDLDSEPLGWGEHR